MTASPSDDFSKNIAEWLSDLAGDPTVSHFAFRTAFVLSRHVNRQTGDAWPSQSRLAEILGATKRGVRGAIEQLTVAGYLEVVVRQGRGDSNHYRPCGGKRNDGSSFDERKRNEGSSIGQEKRNGGSAIRSGKRNEGSSFSKRKRNGGSQERGTAVPPNYMKEPSEDISLFPSSNVDGDVDDAATSFEAWWQACPRKVGKLDTQKAYNRILEKRLATTEDLMTGMVRYAAERTDQDPKFTKHPATWLNAGCWADEPAPAHRPQPQSRAQPFSGLDYAAARFRDE